MKNRTFKKLIITLLFMFLLMLTTNIYASNFNTLLEIDRSNKDEKNIVLILRLKDINFNNTLSTIEANLEYDKEVFSKVAIENLNEWSIVYNDDNSKLLGFKISDQEIEQEELCKITLQLREEVKGTDTQISLRNIKSADGDNLVKTEDKTINIEIENSSIIIAEEQKDKITDKNKLKYLLIVVELVLVITIITSTTYLLQKRKLKKLYGGSKQKNK